MSVSQASQLSTSSASLCPDITSLTKLTLRRWCPLIGSNIHIIGFTNTDANSTLYVSEGIEYILPGGHSVIDSAMTLLNLIGPPDRALAEQWVNQNRSVIANRSSSEPLNLSPPVDRFFEACSTSLSDSWPQLMLDQQDQDTSPDGETLLNNATEHLQVDLSPVQLFNAPNAAAQKNTDGEEERRATGQDAPAEVKLDEEKNKTGEVEAGDATEAVITPPPGPLGSKMAKHRAILLASQVADASPSLPDISDSIASRANSRPSVKSKQPRKTSALPPQNPSVEDPIESNDGAENAAVLVRATSRRADSQRQQKRRSRTTPTRVTEASSGREIMPNFDDADLHRASGLTHSQPLRKRPRGFNKVETTPQHSVLQDIRRNERRQCQANASPYQFLSASTLRSMRISLGYKPQRKRRKTMPAGLSC